MSVHSRFDIDAILASMDAIEYRVVHWFNNEYGFGFITPDDGGPDIHVQVSEIAGGGSRALKDGERVSYVVGGTQCRPQAKSVHVL